MVGLVVAVEADAFCRKACLQCGVQLSFGNDIQTHLFLIHDAADFLAAESLAGVADHSSAIVVAFDRIAVAAAGCTDTVLVHDVKWCAILGCQLYGVTAADGQMSLLIDTQTLGLFHYTSSSLFYPLFFMLSQ